MAGVALFDSALVAYPLYQTSKHILATRNLDTDEEDDLTCILQAYYAADRWLTFWITFGLVELVQGFGADGIPGFHLAKAALFLSLYSVEHATLVEAIMPKVCATYITGADRARKWWNESAVPQVTTSVAQNAGWLKKTKDRVWNLLGWNCNEKEE